MGIFKTSGFAIICHFFTLLAVRPSTIRDIFFIIVFDVYANISFDEFLKHITFKEIWQMFLQLIPIYAPLTLDKLKRSSKLKQIYQVLKKLEECVSKIN